ncbi:hypothetical protein E4U60_007832 [Claviceps pazoutovae]|uniref:Uncharacterized protein n=1 Tax=Claviceps pazoutovae TaxID=1649127 RepID=A0A9P7MEA0_9HYPO|nr:hypothetical protein E4U60_007832 [Claviceps pazoutovae]
MAYYFRLAARCIPGRYRGAGMEAEHEDGTMVSAQSVQAECRPSAGRVQAKCQVFQVFQMSDLSDNYPIPDAGGWRLADGWRWLVAEVRRREQLQGLASGASSARSGMWQCESSA